MHSPAGGVECSLWPTCAQDRLHSGTSALWLLRCLSQTQQCACESLDPPPLLNKEQEQKTMNMLHPTKLFPLTFCSIFTILKSVLNKLCISSHEPIFFVHPPENFTSSHCNEPCAESDRKPQLKGQGCDNQGAVTDGNGAMVEWWVAGNHQRNLLQCPFAHYQFHMKSPGIEDKCSTVTS
jgi:hypothetical protein